MNILWKMLSLQQNFSESTIFFCFSLLLFKCVAFRLDEPKNEQNTKNFPEMHSSFLWILFSFFFFIFVDFLSFFFSFLFLNLSFFLSQIILVWNWNYLAAQHRQIKTAETYFKLFQRSFAMLFSYLILLLNSRYLFIH